MSAVNFPSMSAEMMSEWSWVCAIDAFDYCQPEPLAELIRSEPIPQNLRPVIASIVTGQRQPNKKAAAKLKLPADERLRIAGSLSTVLALIEIIKHGAVDPSLPGLRGVNMLSDCLERGKGREPVEILRELEAEARQVIEDTAKQFNVSVETIENLLRDMRRKIADYPNV